MVIVSVCGLFWFTCWAITMRYSINCIAFTIWFQFVPPVEIRPSRLVLPSRSEEFRLPSPSHKLIVNLFTTKVDKHKWTDKQTARQTNIRTKGSKVMLTRRSLTTNHTHLLKIMPKMHENTSFSHKKSETFLRIMATPLIAADVFN